MVLNVKYLSWQKSLELFLNSVSRISSPGTTWHREQVLGGLKLFWHSPSVPRCHRHKHPAKPSSSRAYTSGGNASEVCYTERGQKTKHILFKQGIDKVSSGDLLELSGRDTKLLSRNPKAHLFLKLSYSIPHEGQTDWALCRTGIHNIPVQISVLANEPGCQPVNPGLTTIVRTTMLSFLAVSEEDIVVPQCQQTRTNSFSTEMRMSQWRGDQV